MQLDTLGMIAFRGSSLQPSVKYVEIAFIHIFVIVQKVLPTLKICCTHTDKNNMPLASLILVA